MGSMGGSIETSQGETKLSGLYYSKIESCEIGNDVLIDHVQLLKNYRVMDRVVLENDLRIEAVTPADEDVHAVYQYLIGDEKDKV